MFKKVIREISIITVMLVIFLLLSIFGSAEIILAEEEQIVGDPPQEVEDRFIPEPDKYVVEAWVENLQIPWELVFLSDNKVLVTERVGNIRLIENGILQKEAYQVIDEVEHIGEGGLMGLAKHPKYPEQKYLYVMYTYRENNSVFNKVVRYRDNDTNMIFDRIIIDEIPGSRVHNGGRIAFGPDDMLYICTG